MNRTPPRLLILDRQVENISAAEQAYLLDVFEYAISTTPLARWARFHLSDWQGAREDGIDGFELWLFRDGLAGQSIWTGIFDRPPQRLTVRGWLEPIDSAQ